MLLDPEMCTHGNFLLSPKVTKVPSSPEGPIIDYILELSVRCGLCHLPFKFRGPFVGIVLNQPVVSENELTLSVPIEPSTESKKYMPDLKIGEA
jgi:hypothetical protein